MSMLLDWIVRAQQIEATDPNISHDKALALSIEQLGGPKCDENTNIASVDQMAWLLSK